jgi:hypothetical protein
MLRDDGLLLIPRDPLIPRNAEGWHSLTVFGKSVIFGHVIERCVTFLSKTT